MNHWLLVDTSCKKGIIAITNIKKIINQIYLKKGKRYDKFIADGILMILRKSNISIDKINGIAIGVGPGSLIGIRTTISITKGICASLNIPLIGVNTLLSISIDKKIASKKFIVFYRLGSEKIIGRFGKNIFFISKNLISKIINFCDDVILCNFLYDFKSKNIIKKDGPNGYGILMALKRQFILGGRK